MNGETPQLPVATSDRRGEGGPPGSDLPVATPSTCYTPNLTGVEIEREKKPNSNPKPRRPKTKNNLREM